MVNHIKNYIILGSPEYR